MMQRTNETASHEDMRPDGTEPGAVGDAAAQVYGLGVAQLDTLDRSLRMIAAHGDLLATVQATDLAAGTLPVVGQAILEEAQTMRRVFEQVETQRLGHAADARGSVEEGRAGYGAPRLRLVGGTAT